MLSTGSEVLAMRDMTGDLIGLVPPQGVGKVGLGGWLGDQVDGSSGVSGHGSGGGGDGTLIRRIYLQKTCRW